jgi:predicted acylesterase/phospholipase RssA/CRP-like cAMP-binding protein
MNSNAPTNEQQAALIATIKSSSIFSELNDEACAKLLTHCTPIKLSQSQLLFEQGEPSDSLYILEQGRLVAELTTASKKVRTIGMIEKGEIVGELGALSQQPRTLTIRAVNDSVLLKLSRQEFQLFCVEYPSISFRLIEEIISRSQATIKLLAEKKPYQHIAITPANREVNFDNFIKHLQENITLQSNIILLGHDSTLKNKNESELTEIFDNAENEGKIIVFVLNLKNNENQPFKLNIFGKVYIVAEGESRQKISDETLHFLETLTVVSQIELILLHSDFLHRPADTLFWLKEGLFSLHHHLRHTDASDYQRLLRFMTGKAIGLVLSGGGNKGWVHLGVIQALQELNIPIDAIGGASIGAWVGACYALTQSYDSAYRDFQTILDIIGNPFALSNFTLPIISLLSGSKPTEALNSVFADIQIEDLWIPFFCISSNLTTGHEVIHRIGSVLKNVRSSATIPGIVPPMLVDGFLFVDGGIINNLPVDCMRTVIGHTGKTIAVSLSGHGEYKTNYEFPSTLSFHQALLIKFGFRKNQYRFPNFFETFFNSLLLGGSPREKINELAADVLINPDVQLYKTISGSKLAIANKLMTIGYNEAMKKLRDHTDFLLQQ